MPICYSAYGLKLYLISIQNKSMQTQSVFRFHYNDTVICWKQLTADKTSSLPVWILM